MDDIMKPHFKKEYGEAEAKKLEQPVDRLESIKERFNRATPGPWEWTTSTTLKNTTDDDYVLLFESFPTNVEQTIWDESLMATEADMEFVAHSITDTAYLLQRLERYEKALKEVIEQSNSNNCNWFGDTVKVIAEETLKEP